MYFIIYIYNSRIYFNYFYFLRSIAMTFACNVKRVMAHKFYF